MYHSIAEEGLDQDKADYFLREATLQIHNRNISAAYQFIMIAYDYSLSRAIWNGTYKAGKETTTLHLAAFFSFSTRPVFTKPGDQRRYNHVNAFFTEHALSKCQAHEASFVKAYANLLMQHRVTEWHKRIEAIDSIDEYLAALPECEKGHYLKAVLLSGCYIPNTTRNFKKEALASIETAIKLKKTSRNLLYKANLLESILYKEDEPQQDDQGLLVLHELCVLGLCSALPFSTLHTYAYERRGIVLPIKNDNQLLHLFNTHGPAFENHIQGVLFNVFYIKKLGKEAGKYYQANQLQIQKAEYEFNTFLRVLRDHKSLFTYTSYKRFKRAKPETKASIYYQGQSSVDLQEEYQADIEGNDSYDDNLDMDQQSEDFWNS